ncbi:CHAD domain-containing protein [Desulfobulbus sp.]|uniref:CYTH and CHAD domain-containing protein n=1 Tax=Desulfobulbus sp. TaxID=895 RepID=UPI00286F09C4|nr:CHAD domain-containing protein [Desulfobulbus sp.]
MVHSGPDTWLLPDSLPVEGLLAALAAEFGFDTAPEYEATVVYADTFDWRLYQQGYLLHCHGNCWTLYHDDSSEVTVQQGGPELHAACFARDFPPGRLRELLAPVLGVRCLLPLAAVHLHGRQIRLLNRDEKTVARIVIETQEPVDGERRYRLVRLFGLRGYGNELETVRSILAAAGVAEPVSPLVGFEEGCRAKGRSPLDYSPKFNLELNGGETAREAMARIYQFLLETISRNMPGVLADYDPEFLHDLRVAIRRTRSGLSLVKRVLPAPVADRFGRVFGRLGALTGPTRDLDVYLLAREDCLGRLPPSLRPGLEDYFVGLSRNRQVEQKKLVRALRAKKNKAVLAAWQRALKRSDRQPADLAGLPVRDLAGRIILKRFKRVVRDGRVLDAVTPDAEVHRLRIQCKKLRYAMEFFGSLYPKQEMQGLIRHLKKLQDILGSFNDLSVQQEMLRQTLKSLPAGSRRNLDQAAALGGLLQSLFREQQELRVHFTEAFAQFGDQETSELFHELFGKRQEPA